jgi:hypothetical protein
MAFAELWLPIIGAGIFIAWAIGAWYGGNKYLATWLAFAGIVCLVLLGTLQWQHAIEKTTISEIPSSVALDQRPWIELLDFIAGPLTYDAEGARLGVVVNVQNTGKTPALKVNFHGFIYLLGGKDRPSVIDEQKKFCTEVRNKPRAGGETLFKERSVMLRDSFPIAKAEIQQFAMETPGQSEKFILPILVGCVDYTSAIDNSRHQTGFAFMVTHGKNAMQFQTLTVPSNGSVKIPLTPVGDASLIYPNKGDIPVGQLGLTRWFGDGFFAD